MNFEKERKKAEEYAEKQKFKQEIKEIKNKYKEKLTFSKWAFIFMIINCTVVEIFSMIAMYIFMDLSALPSLITAVVGECIITLGFFAKSTIENSKNGIIYEMALRDESDG